jgi:hypothetical protein
MNTSPLIIKKTLLFFIIFFSGLTLFNAQQNNSEFWNHVRYGGGLGLNFGDGLF